MNNSMRSVLSRVSLASFLVIAALSVGTSASGQDARENHESLEQKEIALVQEILADRQFDFHAAQSACGYDNGVRFFAEYRRCETVVDSLKRGAFRIVQPIETGVKLTEMATYNKIHRQCGEVDPPKLHDPAFAAAEAREQLQEELDPSSPRYVALYKISYPTKQHTSLYVLRQEDFYTVGGRLRTFGNLLSFAVPGCKGLVSQLIEKPQMVSENQKPPEKWFSGPIIIDDKIYLINVWLMTEYMPGNAVAIQLREIGVSTADNRFRMSAWDLR